jgi:hypothetical protein
VPPGDVADAEVEQFHRGVVIGEVAAVLDDLAELEVHRLDAYLELSRQPGLWPAASRRGQCR